LAILGLFGRIDYGKSDRFAVLAYNLNKSIPHTADAFVYVTFVTKKHFGTIYFCFNKKRK